MNMGVVIGKIRAIQKSGRDSPNKILGEDTDTFCVFILTMWLLSGVWIVAEAFSDVAKAISSYGQGLPYLVAFILLPGLYVSIKYKASKRDLDAI